MKGLITDRTQRNVYYRNELSKKGWGGMTVAEKADWLGDPFASQGVNLFPCGPFYSSAVELKYRSEEILATTNTSGIYLYAVSIIGEASKFTNKVLTLSVDAIIPSGNGTPQLAAYWHDDFGFEYAGAALSVAGSMTFNTADWPNTNARRYLAVYVYVTTHETVSPGDSARFVGVMLESGSTRHPFVPYTEILPTLATKGAYNYSDLNRVERAVAEISDLDGLGLVTKTDWKMWDIPTESEMNRFLGNIAVIRLHLANNDNVPLAPTSMSNLTYNDANNIELILNVAYETLTQ